MFTNKDLPLEILSKFKATQSGVTSTLAGWPNITSSPLSPTKWLLSSCPCEGRQASSRTLNSPFPPTPSRSTSSSSSTSFPLAPSQLVHCCSIFIIFIIRSYSWATNYISTLQPHPPFLTWVPVLPFAWLTSLPY